MRDLEKPLYKAQTDVYSSSLLEVIFVLKIGVLGGDGFCGWPTTLRLSKRGHRVCVVDSLVRRQIDEELGTSSLTPIASLDDRVKFWNSNMESPVEKEVFDLRDYDKLLEWIKRWKPDVLVHFAEQRSAPYSMISSKHRRYTVENNVTTTHNVLSAIVESGLDIHLVHLGTMGVYGYSGELEIPEGRILATFEGRDKSKPYRREILFPSDPGSIYHMTKVLDQHLFYFYKKI